MKIKLNDENLDFKLEDEKTIGDILGNIEDECRKNKMTVVEIKIDNKSLSLEEIDDLFTKPTNEDIEIQLFTMDGKHIKDILKDLGKKFTTISNEMEKIPLKIQEGNDGFAIKIIENFSLTLQDLYTTTKFFDLADIEPNQKFGNKNIEEYQKEISEKLEIILNAFENNDSIEISDIAEYELSPLVKELGNSLLSI